MRSFFVTGIGTGVGKTLSAAVLTQALKADYWKPVQTGPEEELDRTTVRHLVQHPGSTFHPETYHFKEPASPHLAAAREGKSIEQDVFKLPVTSSPFLIIEGAGGLLVPLNQKQYVIDLAPRFDAAVILVCRNYLGCINHSLLSLDYLLRRNFRIAGLVLNGTFDPLVREAIVSYANVPIVAELPDCETLNAAVVSELTDRVNLAALKGDTK